MSIINCKAYNIYIDQWIILKEYIEKPYSKRIIIVDENTSLHCLPILNQKVESDYGIISIPSGEEHKTLDTAKYIWQEMLRLEADRHSLCINLGGGVIGDMGGWTAASFMRGMDFIQVPTTLLAMVDASVGGKLAIDFEGYKNLIGLIKNPNAVFIFPEFLHTCSSRLIRSGMAEVLKHGLIQDNSYWEKVKEYQPDSETDWPTWIYESVMIKKEVTEEDPTEKGLRKILNFGHTLGHAIESLSFSHNEPLMHGEAIAIGMICESYLSFSKGFLSENQLSEISTSIIQVYGKENEYIPPYKNLKNLLSKDKKNVSGSVMYSLLESIGKANYNQEVTEHEVKASLEYYCNL